MTSLGCAYAKPAIRNPPPEVPTRTYGSSSDTARSRASNQPVTPLCGDTRLPIAEAGAQAVASAGSYLSRQAPNNTAPLRLVGIVTAFEHTCRLAGAGPRCEHHPAGVDS